MSTPSTPNRPRIGVGMYIVHNGKVLFLERIANHASGTWTVPGGHLEFGETPEQAAVREALEEVGMTVHSPRLFAVTNEVFEAEGKHYVTLHIEGLADTDTFTNLEPEKQTAIAWLNWEEMPAPRAPWLNNLLAQNLKPSYLEESAAS